MTDEKLKLPLYAKASIFVIGLCALLAILYIAKGIIVPVVFAVIIAIVLHPVVNFFVRKKINRVAAIVFTIFLTFLVIFAFGTLIISQVSRFSDSFPALVDKFTGILDHSISWASNHFDIKPQKIHEWITKTQGDLINTSGAAIGQTLVIVGSGLVVFIGNALWGIPGMFLSIPLLAIVKLICDNIEPLKPWGFLLGDTMPPIIKIKPLFKKELNKST